MINYLWPLPDDVELMLPVGEEAGLDGGKVRVRPEVARLQAGCPHSLVLAIHPRQESRDTLTLKRPASTRPHTVTLFRFISERTPNIFLCAFCRRDAGSLTLT
jgi:hypothetical protein